jgi:cation/acetate symporter
LTTPVGIAFLILVVVLSLLGHFGLPDGVIATVLGGGTLIAVTVLGINGATMQTSEFHLAGRGASVAANGMAGAAAAISVSLFLGLGGDAFADMGGAFALTGGVGLGLLFLAIGITPYFRKSGAFGVVDFLGIRYGSRIVRVVAAVVTVSALIGALAATLAFSAWLTAYIFAVDAEAALAIAAAAVVIPTVLGGIRSTTRTAPIEYLVLALGILVPVTLISAREYGLPLAPLAFGLAAKDAALLALASGRELAISSAGQFSLLGSSGEFQSFAAFVVMAAGTASLPHLIMRSATVRGPHRARRSSAWTLLLVLVVALAAPAYAAFAKLVIFSEVADGTLESLPLWVFEFGQLSLVHICGAAAVSPDAVAAACAAVPGFAGTISADQIAIAPDAVVLAAPSIFGLPYVTTALLSIGALIAALAAAKAIAFAVASAIGQDLYGNVIGVHASAGRRLILTRLLIVSAVALASWIAANVTETPRFIPAAIAMVASGLFPPLILSAWWKRANAYGAVAGMVAGSIVTAGVIADLWYPGFLPFGHLGLDELSSAMLGIPAGFVTMIAASLATPAPSEEQQALVDAIRRPGGTPFVQESESL